MGVVSHSKTENQPKVFSGLQVAVRLKWTLADAGVDNDVAITSGKIW